MIFIISSARGLKGIFQSCFVIEVAVIENNLSCRDENFMTRQQFDISTPGFRKVVAKEMYS